ncbi:MAG TPA: DEAD/DEAH box helicase [Planctomycetaceae bacterium]|nr:DEAD/DEAH box helicase [Planctomycetaceae bacterium]
MHITEDAIEQLALKWFAGRGYSVQSGQTVERGDSGQVVLEDRLRQTLRNINPKLPHEALDEAFRKLTRPETPSLSANNRAFHRFLVEGVPVEIKRPDGSFGGDRVKVVDFDTPGENEFLVVNQFTVTENKHERRPDVVVFLNGLPIAVFELKNAVDEKADIGTAFRQLQTYKNEIPSLFTCNELLVISDGLHARLGSLSANFERFMPWKTIDGDGLAPASLTQLQVLIEGVFEPRRLLDLLRHYIVYETDSGGSYVKKIAGYHQFHAVNKAIECTVKASDIEGNRQVGVVWHTQGSGKSLTMVFYAGRVVLCPEMKNPTIVVITDRNDLDDQLFGTFAACKDLLRQEPIQAENRSGLRDLLKTDSGGVIFTTVHKFFPTKTEANHPLLSDRHNIIVIADEAHRSQYDFIDGFAAHMRDALPNASFIGFTGTPIEKSDANTRAVFGEYISIYDIRQAVEDGATVPIYYESRLVKLEIDKQVKDLLDKQFDEVTEGEELEHKEKLKTRWAQLEAVVGTDSRLKLLADDLVKHFEARLEVMDGKAMIVCMSRRICVELYKAIVALRPDWHDTDDEKGAVKIVMTGSASDPADWQQHIRTKSKREMLAQNYKKPEHPFKIVIVRDMWLTGFDAPCMHTMYLDKPMRGHGLMQAIARVNRVFKDKPGGLVVDYLGIAEQLKDAVKNYTDNGGTGDAAPDKEKALEILKEKHEVCRDLFHGYDFSAWNSGDYEKQLAMLTGAQEHILAQPDGKERLSKVVTELSAAFALAVPSEEALAVREDVAFFQSIKAVLNKPIDREAKSFDEMEHAIRQLISKAVATDQVIDVFAAAGLKRPDISILSDDFLHEVRNMKEKNLAVEMLRKLLEGEIKTRAKKNVVQSRSFTELLETALRRYRNRAVETAQVIEEMIAMAKDLMTADRRGESLNLSEEEIAFYDALEINDSAVAVLGDDILRHIAQDLVKTIRNSITIDWAIRENVRARMRLEIKKILKRYGYPPDKQEKAIDLVLEQAELVCKEWPEGN